MSSRKQPDSSKEMEFIQQDHEGSELGLREAAGGVENSRSIKSVSKGEMSAANQNNQY